MKPNRGITVFLRLLRQDVELRQRDLASLQQQLTKLDSQLEQLLCYQQEYRELPDYLDSASLKIQIDRRLFLSRLETNILTLRQARIDLKSRIVTVVEGLRIASKEAQALEIAVDRIACDQQEKILNLEQSQCDEQGRMATKWRTGSQPFE